MRKAVSKNYLLASTVIAGIAFANPALAQTTDPTTPSQDPAVQSAPTDQTPATQENVLDTAVQDPQDAERGASETIVVTGSRIVSPNITSLAPVQVVGETEIDQQGALNVQEVLLENPAFGTPALSRTNSAFLTSGAGGATVDLRDLGSDRTLVLINSRRVVAGFPGSATVDLNMIPTQFVERIDILTGGASSLYGSDAVAGVVNFIYKRNFEGLLAEGQYGITQRGDSARYQLNLTGGGNFLEDRGNLMVHLGYTKEKGLLSRHRRNTRVDDASTFWYFTGDPEDYGTNREPFFSSFVPGGRFDVNGTAGVGDDFAFDPRTGELFPCYASNVAPTCTGTQGGTASGPFGFNRQFFRTLAVPVERYLFATRGTFEVTDSINLFLEGTYAKTSSEREIEPFATDVSDVYPNGRIPIETVVDGITYLNPLVPAEIAAAAQDTDGDGLLDIGFARRLVEVGSRFSSSTRDIFRIVAGVEGTLFNGRFNWDLSYNYGQTSEQQFSSGQYNTVSARFAFATIVDTNDLDGDGNTTEFICADPVARSQGCVPLNIFGVGSITPEALNYINAEQSLSTRVSQRTFAANISGALFDLPAGPLGVALGAEYRKETSVEEWDALTNAGLNGGNALPDTEGEFDVREAFAEVNVPVLRDLPFARQLNLRAAGRISDYSTVGSVNTWNIGADYAPIEALRFRGTYAKAVRAPNIGELFTGPSQTFPTGLQDPCEGVGPTGDPPGAPAGTGERCRAAPGVMANIAENGVFTVTQADQQGISGFNAGNPNLGVEKAKSLTLGAVFAPRDWGIRALQNLVLSVDYFRINIDDAITFPSRATILQQCYEAGNDAFCQFIIRRPTVTGSNSPGSIEFVNSGAVNAAELKVKGIDTVVQYRAGLGGLLPGWNANARIAWTHLLDGYSIDIPGAPLDDFAGEIGTATDRVNGTIALNSNTWGISFTGTYIGESLNDDISLAPLEPDVIKIPAEFYLDAQLSFRPTRAHEFFVGVDNLLDNDAPNLYQGDPFTVTGSDTAADVYDIFGRRFYAGARLRF